MTGAANRVSAREPHTDAEWHEAVDLAQLWLLVESARLYGLIAGGPVVNVRRCEQIIARGRKRGISPLDTDALLRKYVEAR